MGDETVPKMGTGDNGSKRRATQTGLKMGTSDQQDGSKRQATENVPQMGIGDSKDGLERPATVM